MSQHFGMADLALHGLEHRWSAQLWQLEVCERKIGTFSLRVVPIVVAGDPHVFWPPPKPKPKPKACRVGATPPLEDGAGGCEADGDDENNTEGGCGGGTGEGGETEATPEAFVKQYLRKLNDDLVENWVEYEPFDLDSLKHRGGRKAGGSRVAAEGGDGRPGSSGGGGVHRSTAASSGAPGNDPIGIDPANAGSQRTGRGTGKQRYVNHQVLDVSGNVIGHVLYNENMQSFDTHCYAHGADCARKHVCHSAATADLRRCARRKVGVLHLALHGCGQALESPCRPGWQG